MINEYESIKLDIMNSIVEYRDNDQYKEKANLFFDRIQEQFFNDHEDHLYKKTVNIKNWFSSIEALQKNILRLINKSNENKKLLDKENDLVSILSNVWYTATAYAEGLVSEEEAGPGMDVLTLQRICRLATIECERERCITTEYDFTIDTDRAKAMVDILNKIPADSVTAFNIFADLASIHHSILQMKCSLNSTDDTETHNFVIESKPTFIFGYINAFKSKYIELNRII